MSIGFAVGIVTDPTKLPKVIAAPKAVNFVSSSIVSLSKNSIRIEAVYDKPVTLYIEYGTTTSYGSQTTKEESFNYSTHRQWIYNLIPDTLYHYRFIAEDENGNEVTSDDYTFTTEVETEAESPTEWPSDVTGYDESRFMDGIFVGSPQSGGYGAANSIIGTDLAIKFRAHKTGYLTGWKYQNRELRDSDITGRAAGSGHSQADLYQACIDNGLIGSRVKNGQCAYTIPGVYQVGSGGRYIMEVREPDVDGNPDMSMPLVGASTVAFSPRDEVVPSGWMTIDMNIPVVGGKVYFMIFKNLKPPADGFKGSRTIAEALALPEDVGYMSLNGIDFERAAISSRVTGPYLSDDASGVWYSRNSRASWSKDGWGDGAIRNMPWYLAQYDNDDDYWVGFTNVQGAGRKFSASSNGDNDVRIVEGNTRVRQKVKVPSVTVVDGVWINLGLEGNGSNGTALTVQVKTAAGTVLATASVAHDPDLYAIINNGYSGNFDIDEANARQWYYADLNTNATLAANTDYYIEFSAATGAGFRISGYQPRQPSAANQLFTYNWDDPSNPLPYPLSVTGVGGYAQASTNAGSSWTVMTKDTSKGGIHAERQVPVLLTVDGMPKTLYGIQ